MAVPGATITAVGTTTGFRTHRRRDGRASTTGTPCRSAPTTPSRALRIHASRAQTIVVDPSEPDDQPDAAARAGRERSPSSATPLIPTTSGDRAGRRSHAARVAPAQRAAVRQPAPPCPAWPWVPFRRPRARSTPQIAVARPQRRLRRRRRRQQRRHGRPRGTLSARGHPAVQRHRSADARWPRHRRAERRHQERHQARGSVHALSRHRAQRADRRRRSSVISRSRPIAATKSGGSFGGPIVEHLSIRATSARSRTQQTVNTQGLFLNEDGFPLPGAREVTANCAFRITCVRQLRITSCVPYIGSGWLSGINNNIL